MFVWNCTGYPLLIQFHQLFRDFGRVEGEAEAVGVQFRDEVLQNLLEGQASSQTVLRRGGNSILQNGAS